MAGRPIPFTWLLIPTVGLLIVLTALWQAKDTGITPPSDSAHHLLNAHIYAHTIQRGDLSDFWDLVRATHVGWPPASYIYHGGVAQVLGSQSLQIRLASLLLLPLILWCTYRLGVDLVNRRAGVIAALMTVFCFGISGQLRQVSIDLPATCAVLLAMVGLRSALARPRAGPLIAAGAACGLCLLTRVQSIFFLAGPVLLTAVSAFRAAPDGKARQRLIWGTALAVLAALLISSPWWAGRTTRIWGLVTDHLDACKITPRGGDPALGPGILYYLGALGKLAGWPIVVGALGTLPFVLRRRSRGTAFLLVWVLGGVIGCASGIHREPRYLLPAAPAMVLLALLGLRALRGRWPDVAQWATGGMVVLTVGATLVVAAWPVRPHHWLVKHGLVEWGYVRAPFDSQAKLLAHQVGLAMQRKLGHRERSAYMLLGPNLRANEVHKIGAFLSQDHAQITLGTAMSIGMLNTPLALEQRSHGLTLLLKEGHGDLGLPLIWQGTVVTWQHRTPIQLYEVPPGHPLRGPVSNEMAARLVKKLPRPVCTPQVSAVMPVRGRYGGRRGVGLVWDERAR